jgi:hypothetical protein
MSSNFRAILRDLNKFRAMGWCLLVNSQHHVRNSDSNPRHAAAARNRASGAGRWGFLNESHEPVEVQKYRRDYATTLRRFHKPSQTRGAAKRVKVRGSGTGVSAREVKGSSKVLVVISVN